MQNISQTLIDGILSGRIPESAMPTPLIIMRDITGSHVNEEVSAVWKILVAPHEKEGSTSLRISKAEARRLIEIYGLDTEPALSVQGQGEIYDTPERDFMTTYSRNPRKRRHHAA